jgi:hypothetical protein
VIERSEGCRHNKSAGRGLHITVVQLGLWRRLWYVCLAAVVTVFRCSSMRIRRPYVKRLHTVRSESRCALIRVKGAGSDVHERRYRPEPI